MLDHTTINNTKLTIIVTMLSIGTKFNIVIPIYQYTNGALNLSFIVYLASYALHCSSNFTAVIAKAIYVHMGINCVHNQAP
ncbi:hypothetical protein [Francisella tularensis]|uniref:hypothetical protein n=1 Tax=Francisella tularensis TaxID=263 RepID=UPI001593EA61|nr:hypothetical protein [Francisella tularensis]MBK2103949.1 hypothetical protein [Francisella tularensis subsp. mediasiatica]NVG85963.1 hypothetical protein [Francisella tularensis]WKL72342.1 hypothetical protein Q1H03_09230 [Francisella tularensis subsp. mediasiatica]